MFVSVTHESKIAGDNGLYSAIEAARLARALRGATIRPHVLGNQLINPNSIAFAPPLKKWEVASLGERALSEVLFAISGGDRTVSHYRQQAAVAIVDDAAMYEIRALGPYIHCVQPHPVMSFDDVKRLSQLMAMHNVNITSLDLGNGVVMPHEHTEASPATVMKKMEELRARFPLPERKLRGTSINSNEEEEEEDEEDQVYFSTNEELKLWCQNQQLEYTDYDQAIRLRATHELDAFRNICELLMHDTTVRVLLLNNNRLGALNAEERLSLTPLRLLAKLIDANETIKLLDLSDNELGPHGFGIIGKALTKNISIVALDLSGNQLDMPAPELDEDPEYQGEDPVFGDTYSGLEAISEVLKKNKFLRCLRLCNNRIHSGAEGEDPPVTDPAEMDPENDAFTPDVDSWKELPLWQLVDPLRDYHRLRVLDLSRNALGAEGARMVATALAENRSVEVLDLTDNEIGFRGLHYIAKLLLSSEHSVLHTLIVRRNNIACKKGSKAQRKMALAAMEAVAAALNGNTRLRRLSIACNFLGPSLCAAMLQTIATAFALEEIDLESNDACGVVSEPHDLTVLRYIASALYGTALSGRCPSLAVLRLGDNNIRAEGLRVLFPFSAMMPTSLREVDLSRNNICNGLEAVNYFLISSPVLRRLDLSYNSITAATALNEGIAANENLLDINLSHNKLGSLKEQYCKDPKAQVKGVKEFLHVLIEHSSLQRINLSHNEFNAVHGSLLAELCSGKNTNNCLRFLDLSGNPEITQTDINEMVLRVASKPGIEAFYISSPYPLYEEKIGVLRPVGQDAKEAVLPPHDQQRSLLGILRDTVCQNSSLLDINCDLQRGVLFEEDSGTVEGEIVGEIRQRLLLNALLASGKE